MLIVIGGGPAGFFGAIRARETAPDQPVILFEKSGQVLRKVTVSGGGRCNVTHACFEPAELVTRFPRGGRELRGPFHAFGPHETVAWFAARDVELKTEADGRMFPVTDSSQTIVDCLREAAGASGVDVRTRTAVTGLVPTPIGFSVRLDDNTNLDAEAVLLASGGQTSGGTGGYDLAAGLGHNVIPAVPSLFTFKIENPVLNDLAGVAVPEARVKVLGTKKLVETGPVLVTHWGLSGPAVLRLSAWGARHFHDCGYNCQVAVNWCPNLSPAQIDELLQHETRAIGKQLVSGHGPFELPKRLWQALVRAATIADGLRWADLGRKQRQALARRVGESTFQVSGQATNNEEFVTCGGVALKEVDFRTMASRVCPGLYLAGEVLDIDGITGGYNFQSCWTTGWLAGTALAGHQNGELVSPSQKLKVLFLCTGNSCRSQMAEGWAKALKSESISAWSAGIETHGLNPSAVQVMAEAGVDISGHRSELVHDLMTVGVDVVVTVCGHAHESCPVFPGQARVVHRPFDDPPRLAEGAGSEEEALAHYRRVRDEIREFVAGLPDSLA